MVTSWPLLVINCAAITPTPLPALSGHAVSLVYLTLYNAAPCHAILSGYGRVFLIIPTGIRAWLVRLDDDFAKKSSEVQTDAQPHGEAITALTRPFPTSRGHQPARAERPL